MKSLSQLSSMNVTTRLMKSNRALRDNTQVRSQLPLLCPIRPANTLAEKLHCPLGRSPCHIG